MTKHLNDEELEDLLRLVKQSLDGEASDEEAALLERYLSESDEAQRVYWRIISGELALRARADASLCCAERDPGIGNEELDKESAETRRPGRSSWPTLKQWTLAVSLLFVVAASLLALRHDAQTGSAEKEHLAVIADLKRAAGAEWILGNGDRTPFVGGDLLPGNYVLGAGIVELRFRSGATAIIEGPASWDLIDPMTARLYWGRIVTDVPPEATGFQVNTDEISVVDIGTACGIHVSKPSDKDSHTEVHVFDGLVELHPSRTSNDKIRQLSAGQANLFDTREDESIAWSDIAIRPEEFVHQLLPTVVVDPAGQRSKLIDDFADGNVTIENQVYYPLAPLEDPEQGKIDPARYVAGDFILAENGSGLHGQIPAGAIDPMFVMPLPDAIDVAEYPFFRVRLRTDVNQSAAVYYLNEPDLNASESRYAHEPIVGAQAGLYREIRVPFNMEGLMPHLAVNALRIDPATIIKNAEEGRFTLDYIFVDRYLTAGIAEFDLDHEEYLQGWSCLGVDAPEISGSVLRGTTLTGRSRVSHVRQSISTDLWSAIELRLKLDPEAGDARLGWGKPGDDLSFDRGTPLPNPGDGEFHTYLMVLKPQYGWTDTITKLALWPGEKVGCEFQVDYIRLLAMPDKAM